MAAAEAELAKWSYGHCGENVLHSRHDSSPATHLAKGAIHEPEDQCKGRKLLSGLLDQLPLGPCERPVAVSVHHRLHLW